MRADKRKLLHEHAGCGIAGLEYLVGGSVGEVWLVRFDNGEKLVAKTAEGDKAHLDIEGMMLDYLHQHSCLPLPKVILAQADFLVLEYISHGVGGSIDGACLARYIAELHEVSADLHGFECDTLIGSLSQPNKQSDSWLDFFVNQRLLYMARLGRDKGGVSEACCRKLDMLVGRIGDYLDEPNKPSLLHGDLWFGNVICTESGGVALIDPAIYYGDGEIELAYSQLFGGIGESFLSEYANFRSLSSNFISERMPIYQLYPLLVHACLFGGGYGMQAESIIDRFI